MQTVDKLSRFLQSDEKLLNRGQYRFLAAVLIKLLCFAFTCVYLFIYLLETVGLCCSISFYVKKYAMYGNYL